ncbi:MAG TPA: hypothetical protein VHO06_04965 [Polyangia bacterium]|nr:hypothetical protein [Polyangia bacterium]
MLYTFDRFGCPVACHDALKWDSFYARVSAAGVGRHEDFVGRFRVQTYFLGLDLRGRVPWGPDPLIWETWVSEPTGEEWPRWRQVDYFGHATQRAAAAAHRQIVLEMGRGIYTPSGRRWVFDERPYAPPSGIS